MQISVLSSGSKANSTFVDCDGFRFLIDCGLSGREVERRLAQLGVEASTLRAILVTHEHHDHICGISALSRRYKIPVYANKATAWALKKVYAVEKFFTGVSFGLGSVTISPFSIVHDARDPVGFTVESRGLKFTQCTDLGKVTPLVRQHISGSNMIVLESNHDPELLQQCHYPWELKQRIRSSHGHISNQEAGELLAEIMHDDLVHVVLGHLSENSNNPETALGTVSSLLRGYSHFSLSCGSVHSHTPLLDCEMLGLRRAS